ncbi:hypothetical protein GEV47_00010 [Glaciimonas sp. GS1]|uniref:Binding-protein-dependent transport system inner membrane component n=1 Tax=Glaciimonas soli TaxID=2590999 RepID=A0A843YNS8_9BURK|nr:hypothetical protein [Glaciimonas soli]
MQGYPFLHGLMLSFEPLDGGAWSNYIKFFNTDNLYLTIPGLAMAFCLSFVQAFSVFPSAVLLGSPAGPTRVISIAAYEAAFENYDYPMASTIAMIMGMVQLAVVAFVLGLRSMVYRGPVTGGKG